MDLRCKYCHKPIYTLLNNEMQCFYCYDQLKKATPQRHNHKAKTPHIPDMLR